MLSPQALKIARGSSDKESGSAKKEFESAEEISLALAALRTAIHCVHPWNFSVVILEFFLNSVQFGDKDISNKAQKISFLTDFIDEVLMHNAEAWDDCKPFLNSTELSNKWLSGLMLKFPRTGPSKTFNQENTGNSKQKKAEGNDKKRSDRPFIPLGLCRRFNFNSCPHQKDASCTATWDSNKPLKHECAFYNAADKTLCLKNHSWLDHK
jgi:hypothetical protein